MRMKNLFVDLEADLATLLVNASDVVVQGCTPHLHNNTLVQVVLDGNVEKGDEGTHHDVAAVDLGEGCVVPARLPRLCNQLPPDLC